MAAVAAAAILFSLHYKWLRLSLVLFLEFMPIALWNSSACESSA